MRISLITPSFQQAEFLEETLRSCHEQSSEDLEHIVVDGGSNDGSKEIIEQYANKLAWWCSETDRGQSHAINKGLEKSTGQVFNWLNSDDLLTPDALVSVQEAFNADSELLALGGKIIHRTEEKDELFAVQTDSNDPENFFTDHAVLQPATFFRMDVVKAIGGVEEKLRYVMDYELWLQFVFRYGTSHIRLIPEPLAIFRIHEESKTMTAHARFLDEMASVLHGLCINTGSQDLGRLLALGYDMSEGLRTIPADPVNHRKIVRKMTLRFLLKWNGTIHQKGQFVLMKAFLNEIRQEEVQNDPWAIQRYRELQKQLAPPTWSLFRLKRKLPF